MGIDAHAQLGLQPWFSAAPLVVHYVFFYTSLPRWRQPVLDIAAAAADGEACVWSRTYRGFLVVVCKGKC